MGIARSKLVEDGFQRMSRREADGSNNQVPCPPLRHGDALS
jgi:hypothetical protein